MKAITLSLGDEKYTIKPLRIGQLRELVEAVGNGTAGNPVDRAASVLKAALAKDYPSVDVMDIPGGTLQELSDAANAVLKFSGLIPQGASAGEVLAPSNGATSTGG